MRHLLFILALFPAIGRAEVPAVATDIAPVHSLVSQVMKGVGTPTLVIPSNASPHFYAMRPSDARNLSAADLVVWVGPELTPWLEKPLDALAGDVRRLSLAGADGIALLPFRSGALFAPHDHDHAAHEDEHKGHDHDAHKEAAGHDHDGHEEGHDGHDEDHTDHADHASGADPHIWLDPRNGAAALGIIAETLAEMDPDNADIYRQNAREGQAELERVSAQITQRLSGAAGRPFIVFHDAFHYFEARFGVEAMAAVAAGDAATPGAARISELREQVVAMQAVCAFAEPQMNTDLLRTVVEGAQTRLAVLDPLGSSLTPGPQLYPDLLLGIADAMADCLNP